MTIPATIINYFEQNHIDWAIVAHPHSSTSLESAHSAHISGECVAKGVLLTDSDKYVLAVLPASHDLKLPLMEQHLGTHVRLASEQKLADVFKDCTPGAVPALGNAYGVRTVVEPALADLPAVYFEAGDHEDLIQVSGRDFGALMTGAEFAHISEHN